jgi:hypothetical protein
MVKTDVLPFADSALYARVHGMGSDIYEAVIPLGL